MDIFISRIKANDDFENLLPIIKNNDGGDSAGKTIKYNKQSVCFRYNEVKGIIVIKGQNIALAITQFFPYFTAENHSARSTDAKSRKMVEQLKTIIITIKNKIKVNQSDDKDYLFIHWGGSNREKYSARLRNAVGSDFPFIISYFSNQDNHEYDELEKKTIYKVLTSSYDWNIIEKAIKILRDPPQRYSRKVYEIMERIYIRGFPDHIINKPIKIDDSGIFKDSQWLTEQSKNVLSSLPFVTEDRKKDIEQIYKDTESFKKFIQMEDKSAIKITKLKDFRQKINELLNILSFPIYSRDL